MGNAFMTTFFVPAIMEERPVFIKERHDACYRVSSYVLHKVIIEAIANVPAVILFSVPIYFATPLLNHPDQFFFFMLTLFTLNICSSMLALAVASICPSMEIAGALVPAILSLCALAGGFLKPFYTLPVWWQWFSVVDFIAWAYSALMMNQYDGQTWWYCQPPTDISSFVTGGSGEGEDGLSGALSLLGDDGQFDAKCVHTTTVDEFVTLDLNQVLLPERFPDPADLGLRDNLCPDFWGVSAQMGPARVALQPLDLASDTGGTGATLLWNLLPRHTVRQARVEVIDLGPI